MAQSTQAPKTQERILSRAKEIAQVHGIAGVSFRDIAAHIGIKSASVHHHFPSKGDLTVALVRMQRAETESALARIEDEADFRERMRSFVNLFRTHLVTGNRFCLCGMMGAEVAGLPESARRELADFFDACGDWLEKQIAAEGARLRWSPDASPARVARLFVASLEGAMLIARVHEDVAHFDAAIGVLLDALSQD